MIDFIYGIVQEKEKDYIVVDVAGLGYRVYIPSDLSLKLPVTGDQIKLHTHFIHKEDAMELYGFISLRERDVFKHLITVSGVGAKLGMKIISSLRCEEVIQYVINKDSVALTKVSGIGKKGAEKIILELESKFKKLYPYPVDLESDEVSSIEKTSIDALLALGYREREVIEAVHSVISKEKPETIEQTITSSLRILAKIT